MSAAGRVSVSNLEPQVVLNNSIGPDCVLSL